MRALSEGFSGEEFDLLVVGGGVTGACIARDAALRGLSAALVERADFGAGTSANSLKILHGGLRDLRRLALGAVRSRAREQAGWARMAPHLVDPLPFLLPTYRGPSQGRLALRAALSAAAAISPVRARERPFPGWRMLTRDQARAQVADLPGKGLTGAALWHEGQMYSGARFVLALVQAAVAAGARAANHAEVEELLRARDGSIRGARVRDTLDGTAWEVAARRVVVATGATARSLSGRLLRAPARRLPQSLALNVVLPDLGYRVAFALRSRWHAVARQLLFVPWRGRTILGTGHYPFDGAPEALDPAAQDPTRLLAEANAAWDGPRVRPEDVLLTHAGLLPVAAGDPGSVRLLRRPLVRDHAADGAAGLVSVVSVRFSDARKLAESVVDVLCRELRGADLRPADPHRPLPGGEPAERGRADAVDSAAAGVALAPDVRDHLLRCYGSGAAAAVTAMREVSGWDRRVVAGEPVIFGQLVRAARHEMGRTVDDLLSRRTEIGPRALVDERAEELAAAALAVARGDQGVVAQVPGRVGDDDGS